jgi:L,D-transpeptidase catalytic domain
VRFGQLAAALVVALFVVGMAALPAAAGDPAVSLRAEHATIAYGGTFRLSGQITPWHTGESIRIVRVGGGVVASATTHSHGKFSTTLPARANTAVVAKWVQGATTVATSRPVRLSVRTVVLPDLSSVRLFGGALVRGEVRPWHRGASVRIELLQGNSVVWESTAKVRDQGRFQRTVGPVMQPGSYRVRATFADADHVAGIGLSRWVSTPLPFLHQGSRGSFVLALERRLVQLHYYLTGVDGVYDFRTADAVLAFRKVQRMDRVFTVDAAVWRALANPKTVVVHGKTTGYHIEVDQTLQVLFLVHDGQVSSIIHVSTGRPSRPTPDGDWHIYEKEHRVIDGMIYPSWYCWRAAIHGYNPVPTYPYSHGCVRVPPWTAQWMYDHAPMKAEVLIYH